jgi:hypothetical protein
LEECRLTDSGITGGDEGSEGEESKEEEQSEESEEGGDDEEAADEEDEEEEEEEEEEEDEPEDIKPKLEEGKSKAQYHSHILRIWVTRGHALAYR